MSGGIQIAIAVIGSIGAVLVAVIQVSKTRRDFPSRKVQDGVSLVDASESVVDMYREALDDVRKDVGVLRDLVTALRAELGAEERKTGLLEDAFAAEQERTRDLESQVRSISVRLEAYRRGVGILIDQIRRMGHVPEWEPEQ